MTLGYFLFGNSYIECFTLFWAARIPTLFIFLYFFFSFTAKRSGSEPVVVEPGGLGKKLCCMDMFTVNLDFEFLLSWRVFIFHGLVVYLFPAHKGLLITGVCIFERGYCIN